MCHVLERYLSAYRGQSEDHKLYEGHIPITFLQKAILTAGSSILSLVDPARGGIHTQLVADTVLCSC